MSRAYTQTIFVVSLVPYKVGVLPSGATLVIITSSEANGIENALYPSFSIVVSIASIANVQDNLSHVFISQRSRAPKATPQFACY